MLLTCDPLLGDDATLPVRSNDGRTVGTLWRHRARWRCRDGDLAVLVLAIAPLPLPSPDADEPLVSALARLIRATAQHQALIGLENPTVLCGRMELAAGVRLFALTDDASIPAWDEALSLGLPVYGLRGTLVCDALRPDATAMFAALAYGGARCEDGLHLTQCDEQRASVALRADTELTVSVIVRGGFEAAVLIGNTVTWHDRGGEGYVRLIARSPAGTCWLQPRFVAPAPPSSGSSCHHA